MANCLKILVVDDEPKMCVTMQKVLTSMGHTAHIAHDGQEGWEIFQQVDPDCVLMDIKMPRLNGYELLKRIKERRPECRVLMTTAVASENMMSLCMKAGASDYILKPVNFVNLAGRIDKAVSKKPSAPLSAAPVPERPHENN